MRRLLGLLFLLFAIAACSSTGITVSSSTGTSPANVGVPVTLTATVAESGTGNSVTSGTVSFTDTTTNQTLCSGVTANGNGDYTCTTTFTTEGDHSIDVAYAGTPGDAPSSTTFTQDVVNAPTVTVTSTANPSTAGMDVTLSATVTDAMGNPLSGSVAFTDTFGGQSTVLDQVTLPTNTGTATVSTSTAALAVGSHSVVASFTPDADPYHDGASSAAFPQVVNLNVAAIASFTSNVNPSTLGEAVVFTVTLQTSAPQGASGTVTFSNGTTVLDVADVSGNTASFATSTLPLGSTTITATYSGDAFSTPATAQVAQTVNQAQSAITLTSSSNPSSSGAVTFTATVTAMAPANGFGTGNVTFTDGTTTLGTGAIDPTTGVATYAATLSDGAHTITATFAGDTNLQGSTASLTQIVHVIDFNSATVTLAATPNPATYGQEVTVTATVSTTLGRPTGEAYVTAAGKNLGTLNIVDGTGTYTTTTLPVGQTTLTVTFNGQGFWPSGSSTIDVTIQKGSATVQLASSKNPAQVGDSVTFTATVSAGATGVVEFYDGTALLGTAPVDGTTAKYTTATLTAGTHPIKASYKGGDSFNAADSGVVTETITAKSTTSTSSTSTTPSSGFSVISGVDVPTGDKLVIVGSTQKGCATGPSSSRDGLGAAVLAVAAALFIRRRRRN